MIEITIFDFENYRDYLKEALGALGRGSRSRLAQHLNCQTAFISQVLGGKNEFSPEHSYLTAKFLKLDPAETNFLLLLVNHSRAGHVQLKEHLHQQILGIRQDREQVASRISPQKDLSEQEKAIYYSHWYHAAVHVLVSTGKWANKTSIAERLALPVSTVSESLEFLVKSGVLSRRGSQYSVGNKRLHIGGDSPYINKHHINWRFRGIHDLDRKDPRSLHFSSSMGISKQDVDRVRELSLKFIEEVEAILVASEEEEAIQLNLDLFKI